MAKEESLKEHGEETPTERDK